ncbi:LLM class flavin-dependent oxidoreductase [Labedaea rhizosphaerae]|uniref:5,10-methylenetetrahydromethanopterin reductase n=1 Tax=Labedaea rhizosphaerae TaxID=598644 RepID=A0A4R6S6H1_LABRH|nr:LLM class flavin-dependent oxidoreductase [Labedaea rhizosphaerae]TDP94914.1 5,10-methylenetetrahydromethanopterin reductase [Labedaea rhizosphaerae]
MRYSCALAPNHDIVDRARLAERLGYHRVWVFESPAMYGDTWIALARVAEATDRIGLATGVSIPGLRHPVVTASAAATVEELAPGRLVLAFGTGATGRSTLGRKPLRLTELADHVRQVRALLAGAVVEIDGRPVQRHLGAPVDVPVWLAVSGPKGLELATGAPGVIATGVPPGGLHGWADVALLRFGTVLDVGEDHTSPRVQAAAGPGYVSIAHLMWQQRETAVDALPGGRGWRTALEAERPARERHLVAHQGHLQSLTERDRLLVDAAGPGLLAPGWSGDAAEIRRRIDEAAAAGVTEIVYVPAGPDRDRELTAFATAARP